MSSKAISTIITDVKVLLDQNEASTPLSTLGDTDQLQTDDIIKSVILRSLRIMYDQAPTWMLSENIIKTKNSLSPLYTSSTANTKGAMLPLHTLTTPMYRPLSLFIEGWQFPVTEFLDRDDVRYSLQKSEFAGIRGTSEQPMVFICNDPTEDGRMILEIYPKPDFSKKAYLTYLPQPTIWAGNNVSIPDVIYDSFLYTAAGLYYATLGNADASALMDAQARRTLLKASEEGQQ